MLKTVLLLYAITQAYLCLGVQGKSFFGVGHRIDGDQLLLKDEQHSRPGSSTEQPRVVFNYEIAEPINYIEITSEENILAEVKFSYVNELVVGMVTVVPSNNHSQPAAFVVRISIYGFNDTILNMNPALFLNRDKQFEGYMNSDDDTEYAANSGELVEAYANSGSDVLEVDIDEDDNEDTTTDASGEFEANDKIIEVGKRQNGDKLIFKTFQTSENEDNAINHTVTFYYVDSDYITYIKFVIFDHFETKHSTAVDYKPPLAEYTHFSPNTLKAVITDSSSVFAKMYVYGYPAKEVPKSYQAFLPPPHWQRALTPGEQPPLTPLQRIQLLLLTGKTTKAPTSGEHDDDDDEDDGEPATISARDMEADHDLESMQTRASDAALEQLDQRLWTFIGMLLLLLHN
ncbi:uncharacterized protein LOC115621814 [Scaptodrosophila lebanonensis]|uniref:Uncharacterized protein LOC115621814 n=1 Tax=Drosophila lebanonensis TaxID=7225 RepID=A0A6J2T848_DROLE|nr:uncharacterized protein LOC115621814 [Scaptodrosophila lebanonensis]